MNNEEIKAALDKAREKKYKLTMYSEEWEIQNKLVDKYEKMDYQNCITEQTDVIQDREMLHATLCDIGEDIVGGECYGCGDYNNYKHDLLGVIIAKIAVKYNIDITTLMMSRFDGNSSFSAEGIDIKSVFQMIDDDSCTILHFDKVDLKAIYKHLDDMIKNEKE